jgi:hypothetical protein
LCRLFRANNVSFLPNTFANSVRERCSFVSRQTNQHSSVRELIPQLFANTSLRIIANRCESLRTSLRILSRYHNVHINMIMILANLHGIQELRLAKVVRGFIRCSRNMLANLFVCLPIVGVLQYANQFANTVAQTNELRPLPYSDRESRYKEYGIQ